MISPNKYQFVNKSLADFQCLRFNDIAPLSCLLSRENMNPTFSASYIKITITFDALDRFQENKVFQTAQTMNNILKSNTKW